MLEELLKELGISYAIAGGYARDTYYGVVPKDKDIIIVSLEDEQLEALEDFLNPLLDIEKLAEDYDNSRIIKIWQLKGDIDVIYNSANTLEEAIDTFDYNINQYVMVEDRAVFLGSNEGTLVQLNPKVTEHRKEYMITKAKELEWKVC